MLGKVIELIPPSNIRMIIIIMMGSYVFHDVKNKGEHYSCSVVERRKEKKMILSIGL